MVLSATLLVNKVSICETLYCCRETETLPCCPESGTLPCFPEIQVYYRVRGTSVTPLSSQENVMSSENARQVYSVIYPENVTQFYCQEKETHSYHETETHCSEIPIFHASETLFLCVTASRSYLVEIPLHARETPFSHVIEMNRRGIWM